MIADRKDGRFFNRNPSKNLFTYPRFDDYTFRCGRYSLVIYDTTTGLWGLPA